MFIFPRKMLIKVAIKEKCFRFSQSYDIGKMNMKYGPGSEVLVRQYNINFHTNMTVI